MAKVEKRPQKYPKGCKIAMVVKNITRNTILSSDCGRARTFLSRFAGLQFKKSLPEGGGLLLTPCNSIHTFFMRFAIDAVFIDSDGIVLHIAEGVKPWRVSKIISGARSVLELPAGTAIATGTKIGDRIEILHN